MSASPPTTHICPPYLLGFIAVAVLIGVAGSYAFPPLRAASQAAMSPQAVAARLATVSHVEFEPSSASGSGHALRSGQEVFAGVCMVCHGAGIAGAPKAGDKKAWAPRIAQGFDTLVKHATEGYKAMPPKGGSADLDPQEVARAVAWMADQAGASFKEP
jgi:cytochrome c5